MRGLIAGASIAVLAACCGAARADMITATFGPPAPVVVLPFPGTVNLSTSSPGFDNWTYALPAGPLTTSGSPGALQSDALYFASAFPDDAASQWEGLPFTGQAYWLGATRLVYANTFDLSGARLDTAKLSGGWAVGGGGWGGAVATLSINGTALGTVDDFATLASGLAAFSVDPSLLLPGLNTLSVTFSGGLPEYDDFLDEDIFRINALLTASPIPEPSPLSLLLLAPLLGFWRKPATAAPDPDQLQAGATTRTS